MILIDGFKWRRNRVRAGLDTGIEMFWRYVDRVLGGVFRIKTKYYSKFRMARRRKTFWNEEDRTYHIKDMRFPKLDEVNEKLLLGGVFEDTFCSYLYLGDKYDEAVVDFCDLILNEGLYGLVNDKVNVTVEPGDIVIDAGAWIGDFAAYASVKGATCYAFEPTDSTFSLLQKTAELNGNIIPVKKGLSNEETILPLFLDTSGNTEANTLLSPEKQNYRYAADHYGDVQSEAQTVRLDDFVRENNLPRVDFIKCDIEGFERNMLEGAQETLARFAPKLALCTYHLPDDPQVMEALIRKANPKYNIVQKRCKLFASVPEE